MASCELGYGDVTASLEHVDRMVVQDSLCKAAEVLMTTTTGNFYGKARAKSLEVYGMVMQDCSQQEELSECSEDDDE